LQKDQREAGKTFVSRTRLRVPIYEQELTVMRVVLANPLTTDEILTSVLDEQCTIVLQQDIQSLLQQVNTLSVQITEPPASACA
ncbi:MAG: putative pyridoxal-dependent aspartate 1-decarboxylase, partial [Desulfuromonadales bacterium]|nr:putative pyridoxal-dependent aspartate 1-decarboxylase [Desulfuromonadales bacterium]